MSSIVVVTREIQSFLKIYNHSIDEVSLFVFKGFWD